MHVNKEASSLKILNNVSNTLLIMAESTSRRQSACNARILKQSRWWCVCVCVCVHQCGRFNLCTPCDFSTQRWCIVLHFLMQQSKMTFPATTCCGTFIVIPLIFQSHRHPGVRLVHSKRGVGGMYNNQTLIELAVAYPEMGALKWVLLAG